MAQAETQIAKAAFGKTGLEVSLLGVGGYHLTPAKEDEKHRHKAREYHDAES